MVNLIFYCKSCKKYTLEKYCSCSEEAVSPKPAKFSLEDKYGLYRRSYKKEVKE